jgi:hypothetical protein
VGSAWWFSKSGACTLDLIEAIQKCEKSHSERSASHPYPTTARIALRLNLARAAVGLRKNGVRSLSVGCLDCHHSAEINVDDQPEHPAGATSCGKGTSLHSRVAWQLGTSWLGTRIFAADRPVPTFSRIRLVAQYILQKPASISRASARTSRLPSILLVNRCRPEALSIVTTTSVPGSLKSS